MPSAMRSASKPLAEQVEWRQEPGSYRTVPSGSGELASTSQFDETVPRRMGGDCMPAMVDATTTLFQCPPVPPNLVAPTAGPTPIG